LSVLVTAHHADDNIETLLMNFFKGTGISGLHGILPFQNQLLRPLLPFAKEELRQYAMDHALAFVEDSSNASVKYTRNYIRQQVLPVLTTIYPNITENLRNNIERFAEAEQLYRQAVDQHKRKLLEYKGSEVHIPVLKLLHVQPLKTIVHEIIKEYGFTPAQVNEVIQLLKSESGRYVASASHMVLRNRKWLIISPLQTTAAATILIETANAIIAFRDGVLHLQTQPAGGKFELPTAAHQCCIDSGHVQFPLLLRPWKQGDYFYPFGMEKKKKLSRFLIDNKVSKTNKEKIWVVESNKKIIWVVGYRIDNRFKVLPFTENLLCITYSAPA
jgi:tRNA(Ile)-lysidine synthase